MKFEELQKQRPAIYAIASKYGIENIRVFGSVARGDADEQSDVDLMVHLQQGKTLFDLIGFKGEMEAFLHQDVDVVEIEAVKNPLRKRYMLEDAVPL
jgi:predicted nucleotidyltransferase